MSKQKLKSTFWKFNLSFIRVNRNSSSLVSPCCTVDGRHLHAKSLEYHNPAVLCKTRHFPLSLPYWYILILDLQFFPPTLFYCNHYYTDTVFSLHNSLVLNSNSTLLSLHCVNIFCISFLLVSSTTTKLLSLACFRVIHSLLICFVLEFSFLCLRLTSLLVWHSSFFFLNFNIWFMLLSRTILSSGFVNENNVGMKSTCVRSFNGLPTHCHMSSCFMLCLSLIKCAVGLNPSCQIACFPSCHLESNESCIHIVLVHCHTCICKTPK